MQLRAIATEAETGTETFRSHGTVLMAGLAGVSALAETHGEREALKDSDRCRMLAAHVAAWYGAVVLRRPGGCVTAVFQESRDLPDPSRNALWAALEMRRRVERFTADLGTAGFALQIGIASGEVFSLRADGALQASLAGEPAKRASALADLAPPDGVYVDAPTRDATRGLVVFHLVDTGRGSVSAGGAYAVVSELRRPPEIAQPGLRISVFGVAPHVAAAATPRG